MTLLATLLLTGCGSSAESLDSFSQRWHRAVNSRDAGQLYDMLDSSSQRKIRTQLEELRGLSPDVQRSVIDQLGGERVRSLAELTPQRYFASLWHRLTEGQRPGMEIEAEGDDAAYMILSLDETRRQRVRLVVEGGRWAWELPEQRFGRAATRPATQGAAGDVAARPNTRPAASGGDESRR